ncbi:MAG: AbrB/MazE/SpoVT family DNA-binding domain-containing protein [Candidatus Binatia bacterium]
MHEVKLSSKNQIVIPREVRSALRVKAGDKMIIVTRGDTVIMLRKPKRYSKATAGMAKGIYPSDYLKMERESWQ